MPRHQIKIARKEREKNKDPLVFEINGEEYTCQDELAEFAILDLAAAAQSEASEDTAAAFMTFLREILLPTDWQRFKKQAIAEKWTADDMLPLVQEAVEFMTGFPTPPPSDLPVGVPETSTPSKVISLSEGGVAQTG